MELISDRMTSLTDGDLSNVFQYSWAPATVVTSIQSQAKVTENVCETEQDWDELIREKLPLIDSNDGDVGFVLLITPRILGNRHSKHSKSPALHDGDEKNSQTRDENTTFENEESLGPAGQRKTRILPFSQDVFSKISKAFYIHRSISPAINRADVPLFSHEEVFMQDELHRVKARVYNCRSTNAWGSDLAMTVTHFPHRRLSFGVLFGCTESQKKYVIERLNLATQGSAHPLLLPGLFAEIEKKRHHIIFEAGVGQLELLITESDTEELLGQQQSIHHFNRQDKRTVYLDMLHLKHGLTTWSQQLNKMLEHAGSLHNEYCGAWDWVNGQVQVESLGGSEMAGGLPLRDSVYNGDAPICEDCTDTQTSADSAVSGMEKDPDSKLDQEIMARTNLKIIRRVNTILEDYSDKIRECQTRFDGLTMTTQLFQGETSVILALATSQDSRHMRTIALVTMVFLPGTFFATIFSMTFFNWQAGDGESTVSSLFWIYVAFSVISTAVILMLYYYFVAMRPRKPLGSSMGL